MADELAEGGAISVPLVWVGAEDLPVQFLNQFIGVVQPNEIFLMLGSLMPPPIMGETVEERKAQAERVPFVPIKPIVRLGLTPERLKELIGVLQQTMDNYEEQQKLLS